MKLRPELPDDDSDGKKDAEECCDDGVSYFAFVTFDTVMTMVQFNKMKNLPLTCFRPGSNRGSSAC